MLKIMVHEELIERLVDTLKEKYGDRLISVVLFGSVARGEARNDSDIDIIVVVDDLPRSRFERQKEFLEVEERLESIFERLLESGYLVDISPILRTPDEIIRLPPVLLDVVEDGIILYDRDDFFKGVLKRLKKRLKELGSKRVRMGKRWYWVLKPDYKFGEVIKIE
ncbi:putative nucleotidyltransferase [Geoglobus ahangari]|uniref:Putative nucleotidyltransferase n=2 Tax=Geoglobus ahangari TaxID=113653 RepID=A0A0F7IH32_9EURY|nr:putative nucleotidyltransferase [Geoglobus ahangari]